MFEALWKGILLGLPLVISVGPVIFTIIKLSVNYGKPAGFSFVAGVWVSDIMWVVLANLFLGLIQQFSNEYTVTIGVVGGIFLLGMGLFNLFFKKAHVKEDQDRVQISSGKYFRIFTSGFLINTLNPAVVAFWAFTAPTVAGTMSGKHRFILFSTCLLINMTADVLKVTLAGKIGKKLNDKTVHRVDQVSGFLLITFGIALIVGILYQGFKN
ncbi:LysE family translocator [Ferruginibacter sp. SUN002]|uniref:LysE family translocator n=1 Tax=Ferruginibacter sp. SUN002 TaxID=2937789 RepID=UPI003D36225B